MHLSSIEIALRFVIPSLYLIIACGYLVQFAQNRSHLFAWMRPTQSAAITVHALHFAVFYSVTGHFPFRTVFEALYFCCFVLAILYFFMEVKAGEISFGAFLWPFNCLVALPAFTLLGHGEPLPPRLVKPHFVLHVTMLTAAYACFFFSFVISVMYLLQHGILRKRKFDSLLYRLPSLDIMDQAIKKTDSLGLVLLIAGIIVGMLWVFDLQGTAVDMHLKIVSAIVTAWVYLTALTLRSWKGWQGARTSLFSIAGFVLIILTLIIGRHGY
ncbi:MAG: hypothetical protein GF398_20405 [Chitinivibrionales bacterium]|nr:hypothetical protein [Chitinivibrionales bacterium]